MVHKVNTKARIQRHIRIYKEHGVKKLNTKKIMDNYNFNIVFFIVVILFPIYPTLASFVHGNTQYEFYRWDIDEGSILESYYSDNNEETGLNINNPLVESNDSFISINTILDDTRDLTGTNEIVDYEVEPGDSFGSIAMKFEVSTRSIYESNGFTSRHIIQPGDMIKIPPVSWLIHVVAKWDTISSIAKKYEIKEDDILTQNLLSTQDKLKTWNVLVLPWAKKIIPKVVYKPKPKTTTSNNNGVWGYTFANQANSKYTDNKWKYKLVWRKPFSWAWGNCTYYVASYKNVNWRGNANQWLKNARAKWHATGSNPSLWAIVALDGTWYNRRYWHVAIVMEVLPNHIIVSDMNYRRLNEVTYRKIPKNDRAIQWYIYVD